MRKIALVTLMISVAITFNPIPVNAQNKDGVNKIIQQNLEESTSSFMKNTGEDLQDYVQEEVNTKATEFTEQVSSPKFIDYVKSTFEYWWNQLLTFIQQKIQEFGKYYTR